MERRVEGKESEDLFTEGPYEDFDRYVSSQGDHDSMSTATDERYRREELYSAYLVEKGKRVVTPQMPTVSPIPKVAGSNTPSIQSVPRGYPPGWIGGVPPPDPPKKKVILVDPTGEPMEYVW